ncbi:flagellar basal-body MS-ring/collar protein FliF [Atopococcus tabaci]|uniref:flagellar basal-body MS-ring/collar protein FliF n=1 Tax=Atopococcus tabaci TaxID=269774 RepID=UPI000412CBF4|nr:flagellar basal-body MS-ring/collar protein FliF [Atopococcus tabaci]
MDKVKNTWDGVKSGWEKMEKGKKIQLGVIVSAIAIVVLSVAYFTQRPQYTVLFSELEEADAGAIVEDLEVKGMQYQLEDSGTTILIDEEYIDKYRIDLAVEGLMPANSTGFEIFDEASMMATNEDRQIMYQRAVSGELERAITALDTVNSAKVLLSIPEDSIFQNPEYQQNASASIVLDTRGSQPLSHQTVQGIASLVSGAVDHLPIENIQIVDTNGNLLSASLSSGGNFTSGSVVEQHQQITQSVEADLQQKVLNLLGPIYGMDKVRVTVNADLNFDAIEVENIQHDQGRNNEGELEPTVRSESIQASGGGEFVQGAQGGTLDSNSVTEFEGGEETESNSYNRTTNYEVDTYTEKIVRAPGAIETVSASVIVMDAESNRDKLIGLVENALGMQPGMSAVQLEFFQPMDETPAPTLLGSEDLLAQLKTFVSDYGIYLLGGLVLIVLLTWLLGVLKRRSEEDEFDEFVLEAEPVAPVEPEISEFEKEAERKIRESKAANEKENEVRKYAKENPELASEMIKIWMKEK